MHVKKHSIPANMHNAVCATARAADAGRAQPLLTGRLAASSACLMATLAFGAAAPAHAQTAATGSAPATTAAPSAAVPQNRATSADLDQAFKQTDANGDGKISREEAVNFPAVLQRFEAIDTDRDSFVSRTELGKAAGA